jgi:hypothetical protein
VSPRQRLAWHAVLLGLVACAWGAADAAPVAVRFPEGSVRGFLVLRSAAGDLLADGELLQVPRGDRIEARLVFRFKDGSLHDEVVLFSQRRVFTVVRYHLVQRGSAFRHAIDASIDRPTGRYTVRFRERPDGSEDVHEGPLDLPPDVYNGMPLILAKNLAPAATATGHFVAFTPKPRLVKMELAPAGEDAFVLGETTRKAIRYRVRFEIGGLAGVLASLVGKEPPELVYSIATGPVPAFVRFDGPLSLGGPTWRVELTAPRWPK